MTTTTTIAANNTTHMHAALRAVCAAAAAVALIDAIAVGAPGLGLIAVPFLVAAIGLRVGRTATFVLLAMWSLLILGIYLNYAIANGFDAPWGDIVGVYFGIPLSAVVLGLCARRLFGASNERN
jgi:hypothetical protein